MTVRVPSFISQFENLDDKKLAAILTPLLLSPISEDGPSAKAQKAGTAWRNWGDAHGKFDVID